MQQALTGISHLTRQEEGDQVVEHEMAFKACVEE